MSINEVNENKTNDENSRELSEENSFFEEELSNLFCSEKSSSTPLCCNMQVVEEKRMELNRIQNDLDDLMSKLNAFVADLDGSVYCGSPCPEISGDEQDTLAEKQDGPSEKELNAPSTDSCNRNLLEQLYITDDSKPPEVNWDAVGPILKKHVSDLQQIHVLNQMTNAVMQRIRNVAQIDEAAIFGISSTSSFGEEVEEEDAENKNCE